MLDMRKTLALALGSALLCAGVLAGCSNGGEVHKPSDSTTSEEVQERKRAMEDDISMKVYLNDGTDPVAAQALAESIKGVDGVTGATYVDEQTAKEQAADPASGVSLEKAYIEYTVTPDADSVAVSEQVYAINGVKEASITDSPAVRLSWINNGEGSATSGEYVRVENNRKLEDGTEVYGVDWVPVSEETVSNAS